MLGVLNGFEPKWFRRQRLCGCWVVWEVWFVWEEEGEEVPVVVVAAATVAAVAVVVGVEARAAEVVDEVVAGRAVRRGLFLRLGGGVSLLFSERYFERSEESESRRPFRVGVERCLEGKRSEFRFEIGVGKGEEDEEEVVVAVVVDGERPFFLLRVIIFTILFVCLF